MRVNFVKYYKYGLSEGTSKVNLLIFFPSIIIYFFPQKTLAPFIRRREFQVALWRSARAPSALNMGSPVMAADQGKVFLSIAVESFGASGEPPRKLSRSWTW